MSLLELIPDDGIVLELTATSKKHLFQELSSRAGEIFKIDARAIFDAVVERERLGSTGIGGGVAIPHARMAELTKVRALFARLSSPVEFDAVDERPVDLVFLLIAPEDASADHLRALARISRAMKRSEFADRVRGAVGRDAVAALFTEPTTAEKANSEETNPA